MRRRRARPVRRAGICAAILATAVAAITGVPPKGTRHVARTQLMGVARFVLLMLIIVFAYLAYRARSGG